VAARRALLEADCLAADAPLGQMAARLVAPLQRDRPSARQLLALLDEARGEQARERERALSARHEAQLRELEQRARVRCCCCGCRCLHYCCFVSVVVALLLCRRYFSWTRRRLWRRL
jgi:hypothetical protein